jgi:hypothetical protein
MFLDVSTDGIRDDSPHLDEFIVHASLDAIDSLLVRLIFDSPYHCPTDIF